MTDTTAPVYRALSMLENECVPLLNRRAPYWRPRPAACWRDVHTPAWSWTHPEYDADLPIDLTYTDAIAAYPSAISSATFAHGELERTGALSEYRKAPGYYRVHTHAWNDTRIVSPLGSAELPEKVWLAHPTVEQLVQLSDSGHWPSVTILDSWTAPQSVRMRKWATAINTDRAAAIARRAVDPAHDPRADDCTCAPCQRYEAIKLGYSTAVQLMQGPADGGKVKAAVKRPDWYATIHAQHAASTWRKVWSVLRGPGYEPVMMGSVDEVVWETSQFEAAAAAGQLSVDPSGVQLGAFKVKEHVPAHTATTEAAA